MNSRPKVVEYTVVWIKEEDMLGIISIDQKLRSNTHLRQGSYLNEKLFSQQVSGWQYDRWNDGVILTRPLLSQILRATKTPRFVH